MKKFILTLVLWNLFLSAQAQYYNSALGLNGTALKTALHNIIKNHNAQTWPLWSFFYTTDPLDATHVWDIYSDIPGGTAPYLFTLGTNQCGTYNAEGQCYNHEHTWPSTFFNADTPMKCDLHHVFPTDGWVNNKRSNYPYGNVTGSIDTISENGSKLGYGSSYSGYFDRIFEPIDSFKGDIARAYFYMSTRYQNEDAGWGNWTMANGAELTQDAITLLLNWHHLDTVSSKEINRNNAIYSIQNNRNPFIDYPIFADCIWGNADCTSLSTSGIAVQTFVSIYPNPVQEEIRIQSPPSLHILHAEIHNLEGVCILSSEQTNRIPVFTLAPGMYVLRLETNLGMIQKKLAKY